MFIPVFAFFQKVVCCSQASFDSIPALYRGLAGSRLCTVQNGVDIDRVDRTMEQVGGGHKNGNFTLSTVGRLIEIKNPISLLTAFQQSADPSSRLMFIGDGHLRHQIVDRRDTVGLGVQVELTGLISRDEVYSKLAKTDLFVSTSYGEGLPIATLEAMTCGCPVLLSDIPPHREIADGTDFIRLLQPDDVAGFAREIKRFKDMPADERTNIGQKCRELVKERFSLTAMHKGYEEIYAQVLGRAN